LALSFTLVEVEINDKALLCGSAYSVGGALASQRQRLIV
jgi:hypothetical protein